MTAPHILLADDEPDILWALTQSLSGEGYVLHTAADGLAALEAIKRFKPDLAIIDITMPGINGLELCRRIRASEAIAETPVIFLTASSTIESMVEGLDRGGDDYLAKPFDLRELKARVRALLRRRTAATVQPGPEHLVNVGAMSLDTHAHQLLVEEQMIHLTPVEFELLHYLMRHPDRVFSTRYLLQHVLGYPPNTADPGLIRWHMKNLRNKIERDPKKPLWLRTVPHHGYLVTSKLA